METWFLTDTALACVELQGTVKRQRNTGDVTRDIILEYTAYTMHALIGQPSETSANSDPSLRFDTVTVDLQQLIV